MVASLVRHNPVLFDLLGHGLPDHHHHRVPVAIVLTLGAVNYMTNKEILLRGAQPSNIYHGLVQSPPGLRLGLGFASSQVNAAAFSFAPSSSEWILDSGATHHMTIDLANLSLHSPYEGSDDVVVSNGAGLNITHIGEGSSHWGPSSIKVLLKAASILGLPVWMCQHHH
ncbi:hypothetical protein F0562_023923 [Nyssa sinensis]|uniref:Uncharacterized protein n=1 Tax=Nyssa sinensis TaxID=561372 RepID=A0A5J5BNN2_9ASTE|nr:hypothetical protein F0562_023923 [Nyssa sinensis]